MKKPVLWVLVFVIVAFGLLYFSGVFKGVVQPVQTPPAPKVTAPVVCTQEAKQCPGGSYVNRTGSNCEFAVCPETTSTQDATANWKMYRNETYGFEVKYPPELGELKESKTSYPPEDGVYSVLLCEDLPYDVRIGSNKGGKDWQSLGIYVATFPPRIKIESMGVIDEFDVERLKNLIIQKPVGVYSANPDNLPYGPEEYFGRWDYKITEFGDPPVKARNWQVYGGGPCTGQVLAYEFFTENNYLRFEIDPENFPSSTLDKILSIFKFTK